MNSKDIAVLKKIQQHTESIMRYCQHCKLLQDFEADSMRVEATVFNLMQIGELAKTSLSDEARHRSPRFHGRNFTVCGTALSTAILA
jgi:hypothetical protein